MRHLNSKVRKVQIRHIAIKIKYITARSSEKDYPTARIRTIKRHCGSIKMKIPRSDVRNRTDVAGGRRWRPRYKLFWLNCWYGTMLLKLSRWNVSSCHCALAWGKRYPMGRHAFFGRASSCHFSWISLLLKVFTIHPLNNNWDNVSSTVNIISWLLATTSVSW